MANTRQHARMATALRGATKEMESLLAMGPRTLDELMLLAKTVPGSPQHARITELARVTDQAAKGFSDSDLETDGDDDDDDDDDDDEPDAEDALKHRPQEGSLLLDKLHTDPEPFQPPLTEL